MFKLIKMEFKNCINRNEFRVIFITLLCMSIYAFVNTCLMVKGMRLSCLRSGYEMSILVHAYGQAILTTILFVLPLFACAIYSDSYIEDIKSGAYMYITTRCNKNKYIIAKGLVVVLSTFLVFLIPLLANLMLSLVVFPMTSYETNGLPPYFIEYIPEDLFNWLRVENPLLFSLLSITIISFFASLYALLGYSISLFIRKNKLIPISAVMLSYLIIDVFISLWPNGYKYQLTNLPSPTTTAPVTYFTLSILFLLIVGLVIFIKQLLNSKSEII